MVLDLLAQKMLLRDLALFILGVASQRNDLHPVQKRARHVVGVRRCQEHHVRQVVLDLKIVIHERAVLLWVENLKHRRRWIAPEILTHLVDLIEQDQRVRRFGLLQCLDDLPWHRTDVRPAVTTDFRFITNTTKRDTNELAPCGLRNGFAKRRFTNTRRTNEAHDRPLQLLRALLNRKILHDPLFDLLKAIVVGIKDTFGTLQVFLHARLRAPRDCEHPIEIVAHNRGFCRHRRHRLKFLQLSLSLFAGLLRELRVRDFLFKFSDFVRALFAVTQLLLNGFHLLIQIVLALRALHLGFHAGFDLLFDLKHRHFALHQPEHGFKPLCDNKLFQKVLLLIDLNTEMTRHKVSQFRRFPCLAHLSQRLFRDILLYFCVALELFGDRTHQSFNGRFIAHFFAQRFGKGFKIRLVLHEIRDFHTGTAFDQHFYSAVRQLEQLQYVGQHAHAKNAVNGRVVNRGVNLARQQDLFVVLHDFFQRTHRFFTPDKQRHDHMREHDDVA